MPKTIDIATLTIASARAGLDRGDYSALDLAEAYLARIAERNAELNIYLEVFADDARAAAKAADARIAKGERGALLGIPFALKDNMLVEGKHSSSASLMLKDHVATYDGFVVRALKDAGAVILGRTNMDEFAMGSSTENSAFGVVKNPIDPTRVPGGSSGGSSAAVAAGMALATLGSDTGGSIRQPAALCGVVGFKPTYGAVSRSGLMAMASSLDQIGPFTKTVDDAEAIFRAISAHDPMDSTSRPDALRKHAKAPEKLTIGVPEAFVRMKGVDEDVLARFDEAVAAMKKAGHTIVPIDLPLAKYSLSVYYIVQPAEVSANLARYDGIRYGHSAEGARLIDVYLRSRGEGFGREVRRRIMLGTYVLSAGYYDAYYNKAIAVGRKITAELADAFKKVDVVMTPTSPVPAWKIGERANDPLAMYLADIFTVPANIAGLPAISVPAGSVARDGIDLPVGVQFMADTFAEDTVFCAARELERLL
ncbi:MAG TPA: Asp-tRNA(Asn)/Glu-tRNA(Gln) amidotransferase subunit GatA [Candidatus Paceibacterota bacterium]|nr:Asp-tRNA(Asn)/Glu-tRNA(Gln) amidotransferase subunit GatA [Candidatus Paceibacterota bacterium]